MKFGRWFMINFKTEIIKKGDNLWYIGCETEGPIYIIKALETQEKPLGLFKCTVILGEQKHSYVFWPNSAMSFVRISNTELEFLRMLYE